MFNFILLSSLEKSIQTSESIPDFHYGLGTKSMSVTPSNGTAPYAYVWSTDCSGASFSDPYISNPDFTPSEVFVTTECKIMLEITDACGRKTIRSKQITIVPSTFPVEWSDINIIETKFGARLNWEVVSEINNQYFEIQRSDDGIMFQKLSRIKSKGNTQNTRLYSYDDTSLPNVSEPVILYYRIKQLDLNGSYSYSKVVELNLKTSTQLSFKLFPNPAKDFVQLELNEFGLREQNKLLLIDQAGRVVMDKEVSQDLQNLQIDLRRFAAGNYFIHLLSGDQVYSQKLILAK